MTTVRDMRSLGLALAAYAMDHGTMPQVATVEELRSLLSPVYIRALVLEDAWGTPLRYTPKEGGSGYRLVSAGSDRRFDPDSWTKPGVFTDSREDAVHEGTFVRKWAIDVP